MTQSTIGGFFTGGGKGITWPENPPQTITGTITAVHPPEAVNDPKTGQPTERQQVRIELATDMKDPNADFDDGARTLYVKSYMRGAVGDALRKAGTSEPKIGGRLTVTFVRTEAPERPGLSPSKHFEATYEPPTAGTSNFFSGNTSTAVATGNGAAPVKPAAISDAAWAAMDPATQAAVAQTMVSVGDNPPF